MSHCGHRIYLFFACIVRCIFTEFSCYSWRLHCHPFLTAAGTLCIWLLIPSKPSMEKVMLRMEKLLITCKRFPVIHLCGQEYLQILLILAISKPLVKGIIPLAFTVFGAVCSAPCWQLASGRPLRMDNGNCKISVVCFHLLDAVKNWLKW